MKTNAHKILPYLLLILLFSSCGNNESKTTEEKKGDKSISIEIQVPSSGEAIKHIQTFVTRSQQKVMVATSYYKDVTRKKRCDQYDYDLGRCSGADSGAKYGYKMVNEKERRCCQSEEKLVSKITGKWEAIYFEPKNEWKVALEYKDDSKEEKKVNWAIKPNPSGGLQVVFEK